MTQEFLLSTPQFLPFFEPTQSCGKEYGLLVQRKSNSFSTLGFCWNLSLKKSRRAAHSLYVELPKGFILSRFEPLQPPLIGINVSYNTVDTVNIHRLLRCSAWCEIAFIKAPISVVIGEPSVEGEGNKVLYGGQWDVDAHQQEEADLLQ